MMRVAYQGERGAFSESAARRVAGIPFIEAQSYPDSFHQVRLFGGAVMIAGVVLFVRDVLKLHAKPAVTELFAKNVIQVTLYGDPAVESLYAKGEEACVLDTALWFVFLFLQVPHLQRKFT